MSFFLCLFSQGYAKPTKGYRSVIVIDAGHGGLDLGTKANRPYCEEKRAALSTALLAKKYLDQLGYRVILTRATDVFIPLAMRVKKASPARASLFISVHYNSSPNTKAHGVEVFYCDKHNKVTSSKKLAKTVLQGVVKRTQAKSRGVKQGNFYVIRETKIPAVLLEGGFISNSQERSKLKKREYLDKIARGIAEGVDHYFKS